MGRYFHIPRWFLCAITLSVVVAVVSIPLISAMHSHAQYDGHCEDKPHNVTHNDSADNSHCEFCALYAQFIPTEAPPVLPFSFRTPVTPLLTQFVQLRPKALSEGPESGYTTRGPPVTFS